MDNRSFLNVLVRGMALLKKLQRPTLWIYLSLIWHIRPHANLSAINDHICERILLITEPEPEKAHDFQGLLQVLVHPTYQHPMEWHSCNGRFQSVQIRSEIT